MAEIEALTLRLIRSVRRCLYIETQYLASRRIAEALAERLRESNGPEVILVMPETADGWLEAKAMDSARSRLLNMLRRADVHDRFRAYYPVNEVGTAVYVHAKLLIADTRWLKIGSANMNNRSMGFDSECDVMLDVEQARDVGNARGALALCRAELLAEHLRVPVVEVQGAIAQYGSVRSAIECLNTEGQMRKVEARDPKPEEEILSATDLVDPERPEGFWNLLLGGSR